MNKIEQAMEALAGEVERQLKTSRHDQFLFEKFLSAKYPYIIKDWETKQRFQHGPGSLLPAYKYAINIVPKFALYSDFAVWLSDTCT